MFAENNTYFDRLIDKKELRELVPYHPSHIARLEKAGEFQARIPASENPVTWSSMTLQKSVTAAGEAETAQILKEQRVEVMGMANVSLTDALVRSLPTTPKQYEIFDKKISGLGHRISPGGARTWCFHYRIEGRNRRLTLGSYPALSLADVRRRAQEAASQVARGIDPQAEKVRARKNATTNLFEDCASDFIENHAKRNTRRWKETERILGNEFVLHWRKRPIHQITKRMINQRLDEIVKRNGESAANHDFQRSATVSTGVWKEAI